MGGKHFEYRSQVRWGDMDSAGHVNNIVYFRYMEDARIAWFEHLGMLDAGADLRPILARVECDFRKPVTYPGDVVTRQTVTRVGRTSVDHDVEIVLADDPSQVVATGKSVVVWLDYASGKPAPWSEHQRALFSV